MLNVNVPAISAAEIKGVKLTQPGLSCTQPDWVRVARPRAEDEGVKRTLSDTAFGDGVKELPIPLEGKAHSVTVYSCCTSVPVYTLAASSPSRSKARPVF